VGRVVNLRPIVNRPQDTIPSHKLMQSRAAVLQKRGKLKK
jgi:hypothetical protein